MQRIDDDVRRYLMWVESRGDPKFGSTFNRAAMEEAKDKFLVEPQNGTWVVTDAGRAALIAE